MKIEEYVKENIEEINNSISNFKSNKKREYNDVEIKKYLKSKIFEELNLDPNNREEIIKELGRLDYKKSKIKDIANKYIYYESDLQSVITKTIFLELSNKIEEKEEEIVKKLIPIIFDETNLIKGKREFIQNDLKKILKKSIFMASKNGFSNNLINVDSGIMTANAGDSAQFLFLSRAILAGYNTSNVDVRSSRYDTVIDYDGKLLKVQVKGISSNTVYFKDRDRGGQGIDHHHKRNLGKRITSKDCDLYVAVDKQIGICYIIPTKIIDKWQVDKIKTEKLSEYRENWHIIDKIATNRF